MPASGAPLSVIRPVTSAATPAASDPPPSHKRPAAVDACRFCSGHDLAAVFPGRWTVARCRGCGHYSTLPWPTDADLAEAYSAGYYEAFGMWADSADERARLVDEYSVRVALIERFQGPPGRLIEVGAAMGPVIVAARSRGWTAIGYDTSRAAVTAGQAAFGDVIREGDVFAAAQAEPPADVFAAYHVLEHVPDPRRFLRAASSVLVDGGLLVLEVPDVGSFDTRWLAAVRTRVLDVPRHLCHFTPATLTRLVEEAGFRVEHVDGTTSVLVHRLRGALGSGASSKPAPRDRAATRPALGGQPGLLARFARSYLSGGAFCVYARKAARGIGDTGE